VALHLHPYIVLHQGFFPRDGPCRPGIPL
jgi:hypothetical protein